MFFSNCGASSGSPWAARGAGPFIENAARPREWHAGASTLPLEERTLAGPQPQTELGAGLRELVRELGRANRHAEDAGGAAKGTLASIGRAEEQLVFMARGCDNLTVTLCPGVLGKDSFHVLRSHRSDSRPLFRQTKFPANITSAIVYGSSAFLRGGRDPAHPSGRCLSRANFLRTTESDMDSYIPPKDFKLESRPRLASTMAQRYTGARREG